MPYRMTLTLPFECLTVATTYTVFNPDIFGVLVSISALIYFLTSLYRSEIKKYHDGSWSSFFKDIFFGIKKRMTNKKN